MTTTFYSAVLCNLSGPSKIVVAPPDDIGIFDFAPVPVDKKFEGWIDKSGPLDIVIPKGSRWVYTVYTVSETEDTMYPLKAEKLVGGPFLELKEAEKLSMMVEMSGWFVC